MKEKSYVMIRPGFIQHEKAIVEWLNRYGLVVIKRKKFRLTEKMLYEHYAHLSAKPFFGEMLEYFTSDDVIGMIVEGENAINLIRELAGPTADAPKGTIRGEFGNDRMKNTIHASDSKAGAEEEIKRFFN